MPVSANGSVISSTSITSPTTTTTPTTSTSTITRLVEVPQTSSPIQTVGNTNWDKVNNYIRQSDAVIGKDAVLQSVSTSRSGSVTTYYPTYLVNGRPSILAVGLTDSGEITNPIISNTVTGKTLPTIT